MMFLVIYVGLVDFLILMVVDIVVCMVLLFRFLILISEFVVCICELMGIGVGK